MKQYFIRVTVRICAIAISIASVAVAEPAVESGGAEGPLRRIGDVDGTPDPWRSLSDAKGRTFLTREGDAVRVWDVRTLEPRSKRIEHAGLRAAVLSGDGRTVLTRDEREVRLWDVATSAVRSVIRPERGKLKFAEISPDGLRVLTVDADNRGVVSVWHAPDGRLERQLSHRDGNDVKSAQFDPTGTRVVTDSGDAYKLHDSDGRVDLGPRISNNWAVSSPYVATFDPRGSQYVIPLEIYFKLVDCKTGTRVIRTRYARRGTEPSELFFSADGARVAVSVTCYTGEPPWLPECQTYDAVTGNFQAAFARGAGACQLLGAGGQLAICSYLADNKKLPSEVWDVDRGLLLQTLPAADEPYNASPDGMALLCKTSAGRTSVWRLKD